MAEPKKINRYVSILFIALVGGFITKLPYIMNSYYTALEQATGATRMQLGMLSSIYGVINFIAYLPGGYLADRVSAKKLVVAGALGTAVFGLWYAALPGFVWLLVIHMGFAITTVFIFWAAMVKAVNNLGTEAEQGKMFGFLEGSRYLIGILAMYGSIAVFSRFTDEVAGFQGVIVYYSVMVAVAGLLALFFFKEPGKTAEEKAAAKERGEIISFKLFKDVLKYPHIWMCGVIVFCNYVPISLANYINPYFVDGFSVSAAHAATLTTTGAALATVISAYLGGIIADKIGSRVKFMAGAFVGMIIFAIVMQFIPLNPSLLYVFFTFNVLFAFCAFCIKALYFSTIGDVKMPKHLAGASSGVISLVGYAPDMFIYLVIGAIMTSMGNAFGYRLNFILMIVFSVIGFVCCLVLMRMIKKTKSFEAAGEKDQPRQA
ncbi:MAG: MFS transporter [Spirochaetaceae bacterium]|jgi:MFS family permease|nr:MFS transporter [Spirochaetaceae bacterium]